MPQQPGRSRALHQTYSRQKYECVFALLAAMVLLNLLQKWRPSLYLRGIKTEGGSYFSGRFENNNIGA